jgi:hypothetical protein
MIRAVSDDMGRVLESYGAVPSQLVDLADANSPRTLRYVDLLRSPSAERAPVVLESQGQPRAYVFDGSKGDIGQEKVNQWVRRIAFRGDADWVGVLRPGRLEVFRAVLDGHEARAFKGLPQGSLLLPTLLFSDAEGAVKKNVRTSLLALLRESIANAKGSNVSSGDALSLVGRALFWRFLIDRGLLDGLDPIEVCPWV